MTTTTYPLVIARNRTLDWRPLLAPDVLVDAQDTYALVGETSGAHPIPLTRKTWRDRSSREWTLVYRSIPVRPDHAGETGEAEQLADRFGRPLYLVEGVAAPGKLSRSEAEQFLDQAHTEAVATFRDFWTEESETAGPRPAAPISSGRTADVHELHPTSPAADGRSWLALLAAGAALGVLALIWWLSQRMGW